MDIHSGVKTVGKKIGVEELYEQDRKGVGYEQKQARKREGGLGA